MFCTTCGTQLPDEARFCVSCGSAVPGAGGSAGPTSESPSSGAAVESPTTVAPPYASEGVPYPHQPIASKDRPPAIQAWPDDIVLSSPGRRLGAFLLDTVLLFVTLFIGWAVWSLIVWGRGQTPGKQILNMRVVHSRDGACATWWRMAFREVICKTIIRIVAFVLFGIGLILYFWLLWDGENQELWDKMASTLVVDDRLHRLYPRHQLQAGPVARIAA